MIKEILFVILQMAVNVIQTITGFGGAPLAMPPSIALIGITNAKAAITLIVWVSTLVVTFQNLKKVNIKKLGIMLGLMIIGVVVGNELFTVLPQIPLMIGYSIIVIMIGLKKLFLPGKKDLKSPWIYLALLASGLMQGLFTSGGPFLVLYAAAEIKDKEEFRATVSPVWTVLNTYMIYSMWHKGMYTPYVLKLVVASIIPVFAAIYLGNKIMHKIDQKIFLKLVYVLLTASGAVLLLNAL